jgi:hypothetical protein
VFWKSYRALYPWNCQLGAEGEGEANIAGRSGIICIFQRLSCHPVQPLHGSRRLASAITSSQAVSGCDWLGPICRRLAQSGSLVFTSRLVGKGYTTINLVPTPQVKRVSSSQQLPVEFTEDCCSALQMRSLGCFSKDLSILSLVTGTPKGDS